MQSGDVLYGKINHYFSILMSYLSGSPLLELRETCREFIFKAVNNKSATAQVALFHMHVIVLAEGHQLLGSDNIDGVPGLKETVEKANEKNDFTANLLVLKLD